jgi:DNA-binding transcriptional MerR regulator
MDIYTVKQASDLLEIPKATLRYYDQLGIVSPKRAENSYRYYTKQDILDLKNVEVMKCSNFSLAEIKKALDLMKGQNMDNLPALLQIIGKKREWLQKQIILFHGITEFLDLIAKTLTEKCTPDDIAKINVLVERTFGMKGCDKYEESG